MDNFHLEESDIMPQSRSVYSDHINFPTRTMQVYSNDLWWVFVLVEPNLTL